MSGLQRLRLRFRECFSLRYFRLRFWFRRSGGSHFRRRSILIHTPQLLLFQSLLQSCDPAATLFIFRHRIANLRRGRDGFDLRLFGLFEVDDYLFRWRARSLRIRENVKGFAQSSALRPFDGIQTEIIALLGIGAGLNQSLNNMRVSVNYGEDQRRAAAD